MQNTSISCRPWNNKRPPKRILAIRLQAMGDLVITLPYLQGLRHVLPGIERLDLLTRAEVESIPNNLALFDKVFSIGGGRDFYKQCFFAGMLFPNLLLRRYELVIDLQNNSISRSLVKCLLPSAWSRFDRFSARAAGDRTQDTIEALGLGPCPPLTGFRTKLQGPANRQLIAKGWKTDHSLVILNPAGAFPTRNWEMEKYLRFAQLWLDAYPLTQFLVLGTGLIDQKANFLESSLGDSLINLVNQTSPAQAFAIMQEVDFVLSEDSGLMHMAWVSAIPTLALFGSSESHKARPLGALCGYLDSSDLACGQCMLETCRFADNHCMTRLSPENVFEKAIELFRKSLALNLK